MHSKPHDLHYATQNNHIKKKNSSNGNKLSEWETDIQTHKMK